MLCVQEVFRGNPQIKTLRSSFVDSMLQSKCFGLVTCILCSKLMFNGPSSPLCAISCKMSCKVKCMVIFLDVGFRMP